MSRRTIISIIVLMSIALVGLVSFQLFWINSVIKLNNERFVNNVHESLNSVVARLEKRENLFFVSRGVSRVLYEKEEGASWESDTLTNYEVFIHSDSSMNRKVSEKEMLAFKTRMKEDTVFKFRVNKELEGISSTDPAKLEKMGMIQVILQEMAGPPRLVQHRVSKEVLDTLLQEEFANKGIHLKFEYGVIKPDSKEIIIANTPHHEHLMETELKATLFPNDILSNASYLTVNFPNQGSFLFKQIWATLASSLVLLLIIVGCFAFALLTIIRLKKLSEMKNDFINNMTHEFKTPIATVSLACQALGEPEVLKQPSAYQKYLGIIRDENERLESQVERVLQLASMEKEDLELHFEKMDLIEIINTAIEQISIQVEKKGGTLSLETNLSELQIKGDATHLFSTFLNLLDNANKYSPEEPKIKVTVAKDNDKIKVEVSDNGVGMSRESARKIFDKFYRVPTGNVHNVKGFGLGLHYVRSIILAHGGSISVQSEPGKGSTFKIEL